MLQRRWLAPLVLLAFAACKKHGDVQDRPAGPATRAKEVGGEHYRTEATKNAPDPAFVGTGKTRMVVSEAPEATKVGQAILAADGNAADAAVATAFALAVVHPPAGNLAGGGFAVIHAPGKDAALDFREVAPAAATADMFLGPDGQVTKASVEGDRAAGVPGSVAGLWALHDKFGKKPWKELLAPAIALARDGFTVDAYLHASIERRKDLLAKNAASAAMWLPGGTPRAVGEVVKQPELQHVLERVAEHGPDGFYKGETARAIVDEMKRGGGIITAKDLESYRPEWRDALHVEYRGKQVVTMPPPSSGGIVLAMTVNMLRGVDLEQLGWHSPQHIHRIVEVWRRAFAARNEVLGDPAFVKDMPVAKLVSQELADKLASTITAKATPSKDVAPLFEGLHTTNLCAVDGSGMAIALTTTLNLAWGNGVTVSGFLLNDEMDDFAAKPGAPNAFQLVQGNANKIEPGKRMLSSMSPTIVLDHDAVYLVVGAQGGPAIITAVWQVLSNVVDFHMAVGDAVAAARFHHQHMPDHIMLEAESVTTDTDHVLRTMGYKLEWPSHRFGAANAIVRVQAGWQGAADPRGGGAALGD
jgi:gamma-glutamyltranspeptidase/glutathione hydrolase